MRSCLLLLPLALAACSAPSDPAATEKAVPAVVAPVAQISTEQLASQHWLLNAAHDPSGQPRADLFADNTPPLQLDFADGRVSVSHACNRIGGSFQIVDGKLQAGPLMQTQMACADPVLMAREQTMSKVLAGNPDIVVMGPADAPVLSLRNSDGSTMTFAGSPTPETRFGGPGVTEFFEVAPGRIACNHPLIPDKTCLNVRQRYYGGDGLQAQEPGPWEPLYDEIEGFTQRPNERNVLRVKRYTLKNPPADASSVAYVLDMVVESENVKP